LSPLRDRWKIIVAMDRLLAHMLATAKHERYRGERYGDQRSEGGAKTLWCFGCHHDLRLSALMANACTGSRFLHRQHIEKAEQRSRGGGGKIFYRGIRGNGYRYRGAKSGSRSDLSARHDSSKAIMSSQSSATKSPTSALPELASSFFIG
jgi:hypothetical protein